MKKYTLGVSTPPTAFLDALGALGWTRDPSAPVTLHTIPKWSRKAADALSGIKDGWHVVLSDEPQGWLLAVFRPERIKPWEISWQIHNGPVRRLARQPQWVKLHRLRHDDSELADIAMQMVRILEGEGTDTLTWLPVDHRFAGGARQPGQARKTVSATLLPVLMPGRPVADVVREATGLRTGPWVGWCESWRDVGIPGFASNVTMDVSGRGDGRPLPGARDRVSGKGRTFQESMQSAVGELCERRACTAPAPWLKRIKGTRAEMMEKGYLCLPFDDLEGFSDRQWEERDAINAFGHAHHKVPLHRPHDDTPLEWVEGEDLSDGSRVLFPLDYCYYKPGVPRQHFVPDTNGMAAGTSPEDAACRGLRELIERDAVALWWYQKLEKPSIPWDIDPMAMKAEYELGRRGRWVHLLDITRPDCPYPVVVAVTGTWDTSQTGGEDIVPGFGCAPTYAEAVRRALGEAVQCIAFGMSVQARMKIHNDDPDAWRGARWRRSAESWLRPHGVSTRTAETADDGLQAHVEGIGGMTGRSVYGVELSSEGLAVVKTVAPGLKHWWKRDKQWSPGELERTHPHQPIVWL